MSDNIRLHILHSCPFSWKVRSTLEHLQLPFDEVQVHPLKVKKQLNELTQDTWGKVPVLEDAHGVHVDSTPIMKYLDRTYADSRLSNGTDPERHATWLEWVDEKFKDATIPILYGSLRRSGATSWRIARMERFSWFSSRLYAWSGFLIMRLIAGRKMKADGRKPERLWHDLLDEWCDAIGEDPFLGGSTPSIADLAAFGYMRSISPFKQFRTLEAHDRGIAFYRRIEATL